ncbi:MAG: hypothetical protein IJW46_03365 [Clostridia bacterium]|nr:hypothetical protein [Clostridia bacterium]
MKRLFLTLLVLVLICGVLAACGGNDTEAVTTVSTPVSSEPVGTEGQLPEGTLSAEGVFSAERLEDIVTLTVSSPEDAGGTVSIVLLYDLAALHTWKDSQKTSLVNLGEVTLDGEGKGSLLLSCEGVSGSFYAVVTAPSGCYIGEVS